MMPTYKQLNIKQGWQQGSEEQINGFTNADKLSYLTNCSAVIKKKRK